MIVDFFAINEKNIHGAHTLRVSVGDPAGKITFIKDLPVDLKGGDTYGQLLSEGVECSDFSDGRNEQDFRESSRCFRP